MCVELELRLRSGGHQWCSGCSGGFGFGRLQVRERLRAGVARGVDAVAHRRAFAARDDEREEGVHDVVVERASATRGVLALLASCALELEEGALFAVGTADVDDQVVGEPQARQRMVAVCVRRPVRLAVEPVPEREVRVQAREISRLVGLGEVEPVLHVVEVADVDVAVHLVELLRGEQHVLHLGPADALDADVELPTRQRLRDHADERVAAEEARAVDLDDEREHVLAVHEDRAVVGERELLGRNRLQCRPRIEEERVPARACEGSDPVVLTARFVTDDELQLRCVRAATHALLHITVFVEDDVEAHLVVQRPERRARLVVRRFQRTKAEAIDEPLRERLRRLRKRERVHDEREPARTLRTGERIDVGDVRDRIGERPWPRDVIGHA